MFQNYFKIAIRKMRNNKAHTFINIAGLSIGMAVAILIGLWVWDELSFNTYHRNYSAVAQVYRNEVFKGVGYIDDNNNNFPIPLAGALRTGYGQYFEQVALASSGDEHLVSYDNRPFSSHGMYVEPGFTDIFTLKMITGAKSLQKPQSILLAQSLASSLFGHDDATGKVVTLDGKQNLTVAGVFQDMPRNARFSDIGFFCPFSLMVSTNDYVKGIVNDWGNSSFQLFVQTAPGISMDQISGRISEVYWAKIKASQPAGGEYKATIFLHPMKDWHLRSTWKEGVPAGGRIQLVELFGMIGVFVLLLACINFMNLSTARAEKSAREVGIRKTMGSLRSQLVRQFMSESLAVVCVAFVLSAGLVALSLDRFNQLADKEILFPVSNPVFWLAAVLFILTTAILAGSYPSFYLSSFKPIKVLKGVFQAGRRAAVPRRVMVVLQFAVSIALISGTMIVYRQVQYAQSRPSGYDRSGLISVKMNTPDMYGKYDVLRHDLLQSGAAVGFAQSSNPGANLNNFDDRFEWVGKDPQMLRKAFALMAVTNDFGKTVGWQFIAGRDFSTDVDTASGAIILNETALRYMDLKNPVGQIVKWNGRPFRIHGVIKDMITESPYEPVQMTIFVLAAGIGPYMMVKLNPALNTRDALSRIQPIFSKYNPAGPFDYQFVDEAYGHKFAAEQRIGVLTTVFSALAIFISCLGIFGLASFVAEQRTKEIGVRKILGASVIQLWRLLSREFLLLVLLAFVLAVPVAAWFMHGWLAQYSYHSSIAWWIFAVTGAGALLITLATVSYQSIRAALVNPVKSLRSE
jgi:putative ABC transport system permease protein